MLLKTDEVADVLQIAKVRVLKALERRGMVRVTPETLEVDDALAARDPVLAQLRDAGDRLRAPTPQSYPLYPGRFPRFVAVLRYRVLRR